MIGLNLCYNAGMAGITHEQARADPDKYRILSNGAIFDKTVNHIVGNPGGGTKGITQLNSSAMHKKRQDKRLEGQLAAERGMGKAVLTGCALDAWEDIIHARAVVALDTGSGMVGNRATEIVGRAVGYLADSRSQQDGAGQTNVQVNIGSDVLDRLEDILRIDSE